MLVLSVVLRVEPDSLIFSTVSHAHILGVVSDTINLCVELYALTIGVVADGISFSVAAHTGILILCVVSDIISLGGITCP